VNLDSGTVSLFKQSKPIFTEVKEDEEEDVRLLFKVRFLEWFSRFAEAAESPVPLDLKTLPKNELENLRSLGYIK
jgi:hypothetical protein